MYSFFEKFNISNISEELAIYFEKANDDFKKYGEDILGFEKYNAFTYMSEKISKIRDEIKKNNDMILYSYFLSCVLESGNRDLISTVTKPFAEKRNEILDTLPLFGLLDRVPAMLEEHKRLGIPEKVSRDTVAMFENQIQDFIDLFGHYGISIFIFWMNGFLECKIFRIGRFNLQIDTFKEPYRLFSNGNAFEFLPENACFNKTGQLLGSLGCEDDDGSFIGELREDDKFYRGIKIENGIAKNEEIVLPKSEWHSMLSEGDPIISVHIPSGGALTPEICKKDLAYGKKLLDKVCETEHTLFCKSWLLDPQIKTILPKSSNLTVFADMFLKFPIKSNATSVFTYIWNYPEPVEPYLLSENTTLSSSVKKLLLNGGHIWGAGGVITGDLENE